MFGNSGHVCCVDTHTCSASAAIKILSKPLTTVDAACTVQHVCPGKHDFIVLIICVECGDWVWGGGGGGGGIGNNSMFLVRF